MAVCCYKCEISADAPRASGTKASVEVYFFVFHRAPGALNDHVQPIKIELVNYHKDGRRFWVELSIVPITNEKGWYAHWVSVQRDISERQDAEELAIRVRVAEGQNAARAAEIVERKRVEAELLYRGRFRLRAK